MRTIFPLVVGTGTEGTQDGPPLSASFYAPHSVAVDGKEVIYVTDFEGHKVRRITP